MREEKIKPLLECWQKIRVEFTIQIDLYFS